MSEKDQERTEKRTERGLPKIYPYKSKSYNWLVSWRHDGKRERYYFKTHDKAETKRAELLKTIKQEGGEGLLFGAVARSEYAAAKMILDPFNVSIIEAARYYEQKHRSKADSVDWKEAVFSYVEFLERGNRRPRTISEARKNLRYFQKWTECETLEQFTPDICEAWLASGGWKPSTLARYRASLSGFGTYAVRKKWIAENPVEKLTPPKLDRGNPTVYTIEEANRLLTEAAKLHGGRIVRRLALLLLCGMRPTEIDHLSPEDFRPDGVRIGTGKLRGRRSVRFLPFSLSFRAWWDHHPGKIKPSNFRKLYEQAKRNAGIEKTGTKLERHTWISARLADCKDENQVAREAGNSPDVIYNDYFQLIDEAEAAQLGAYCTLDEPEK